MNISLRRHLPQLAVHLAALCLLLSPLSASTQQVQVTLDPSQTTIQWTLADVLHTVHGTFKLRSGQIFFDPATGSATGELVVDAASGNSGNGSRDNKMNKEVLESKRYPEITFLPKKIVGHVANDGGSTVQVQGVFHIHGSDHDLALTMPVVVNGNEVKGTTSFDVPYQAWGMKNPSTFFLRVSDKVQISIAAVGHINTTAAQGAH